MCLLLVIVSVCIKLSYGIVGKTGAAIYTLYIMPNTHRRRDETVWSRWRRRCEHNSQLAHDDCRRIRATIWKLTKQTP